MAVNDELLPLELKLAEYPEGEKDSGMNRRLILREALTRIERAGYDRGYSHSVRDSSEAGHIERQIRKKREEASDGAR
jgi:hypothetical protein